MKHTLDWVAGVTIAVILFMAYLTVSDVITHMLRLLALTKPILG